MSDAAAVIEAPIDQEPAPVTGVSDDVLSLMREGLRETTPTAPEPDPEPAAEGDPAPAEAPTEPTTPAKPSLSPGSRRAKTVETAVNKVKTEAEQRIADAEARAAAAEAKLAETAAQEQARAEAAAAEREQARIAALEAEYGQWIGTPEQYAEAQRLSRTDPDSPGWDWDRHKAAVNNLETWDSRRKWATEITSVAEATGYAKANRAIAKDFLETLAADLPEDKQDAYRKHKDGIPGAVRFYAETVAAPKIEALEAQLAERDAEIERLKTASGGGRSPVSGAPSGRGVMLDYKAQTPEELMSIELRRQAAANGRRR